MTPQAQCAECEEYGSCEAHALCPQCDGEGVTVDVEARHLTCPQCEGTTQIVAAPQKVRCNQCLWIGEDDDLRSRPDAIDGEWARTCPNCLTDTFLMDLP